jgi:hypothetical protein
MKGPTPLSGAYAAAATDFLSDGVLESAARSAFPFHDPSRARVRAAVARPGGLGHSRLLRR